MQSFQGACVNEKGIEGKKRPGSAMLENRYALLFVIRCLLFVIVYEWSFSFGFLQTIFQITDN
jgi:hypothetical protein